MKLFKLLILLFISTIASYSASAQANASINVLTQNSGVVNLNGTIYVQVDVGNSGPTSSIGVNKVRAQISIPAAIATAVPNAEQDGLPSGWIILSNTGGTIQVCNGTDVIPVNAVRSVLIKVKGIASGGPSTVSGNLSFGPGTGVCTGPGALSGDVTADNTSTSTITVNACSFTADSIVGPVSTCAYTTAAGGLTATYTVATTSASSFLWSVPLGAVGLTGQGTNTISFKYPTTFVSGTVSVEIGNGCGGASITRAKNVSKVLSSPLAISGPANACPFIGGAPVTYSTAPVPGAVTHHWTLPTTGATIVSANADSSSINVSFTSAIMTATIKAIKVKGITGLACGNSADKSLTIAVAPPKTPGSITGPYSIPAAAYLKPFVNACPYIGTANQATYVIRKVLNATSYNWTMPVGATASHPNGTGANDTLITVSYNNSFAALQDTIRVSATSPCGTSLNKLLVVKRVTIKTPGTITGPLNVCPLMEGSTVPAGSDSVYWIRKVVDVTSYEWVVPSGATIVAHLGTGANDTAIRVHFDETYTTGSLMVRSVNGCAMSPFKVLAIKRLLPATPGAITGQTDACVSLGSNITYSVLALPANATSLLWVAPAGASIVGSATGLSVQIAYTNAFTTGVVSVYGVNNCATSLARTLTIVRNLPKTPGTITVATVSATCPNKEFTYTIAAMPQYATGLVWTVPVGATIVGSSTGVSIDVLYPGTGSAYMGAVTVKGTNACGDGTAKSLTVNISACTPSFAGNTIKLQQTTSVAGAPQRVSETKTMDVRVYPNPSVNSFKLEVQTPGKEQMQVRIMDMAGREYKRLQMMPGEIFTLGSELKAGAYMVEVRQGGEVKTKRIIKL